MQLILRLLQRIAVAVRRRRMMMFVMIVRSGIPARALIPLHRHAILAIL
jgi:hypothetical protein